MSKYTFKEIEVLISQAEETFGRGEYGRSVELLKGVIAENPEYAPAYRKLAAIVLRTQTSQEALPLINKALELEPDESGNWNMMGHYNVRFRLWDKALESFRKSLELTGENPQTQYEIVKIYKSMEDGDRFFTGIKELAISYPDNITFASQYSRLLLERRMYREAMESYERLMEHPIEKLSVALINDWRSLMGRFGRNEEAMKWLEKQCDNYPGSSTAKWLLAASCIDVLEYEKAQKLLLDAHSLSPKNVDFLYTLAYIYYTRGEKEDALFYFNKILEINSVNPKTLRLASTLHKFSYGDRFFVYLNQAAVSLPDMPNSDKAEMHYAMGKAFEDVGEIGAAFLHYQKGGACHRRGQTDDLKKFTLLYERTVKYFDRSFFEANRGKGYQSKKPVFILGMIRSGTTLTETILSSLQGVHGVGELFYFEESLNHIPFGDGEITIETSSLFNKSADFQERGAYYLSKVEKLVPAGTQRIVDKMPDNFKYAGWIPLILPEASIIHTRRHPAEICLSAYRLYFQDGHYWSDDLQTMGRYYRLYHNLMEHWKSVLPEGTILDLKYEELVEDPETQSKRVAAHIGVEWDPACLEFHKSEKPVKTASAMQVNQPIYKSSVNRWRKYEPYLKPLLDEIGDLVEAYEAEVCG